MPMSNFKNGFLNGVTIRGVPITQLHTGKVFWVNNSTVGVGNVGSNGADGTYLRPFSTIDYAVGRCVASRGDIIAVMPGHTETISAADSLDLDVAGIAVVGLGQGSLMPKLNFTAGAGTVGLDAANISIYGLKFEATVTTVVTGLDIKDGADDFYVGNCRFTAETLTTDEFSDAISVTTSDRGVIENNYFDMDQAAAASAIHLVGICLGCTIRNNYIVGDYSTACIESITVAQEQITIEGNTLINGVHGGLGTVACISLLTGSTGIIQDNRLYTNVAAAQTAAIAADGCFIGGSNTVSTTAETLGVSAEGGQSPLVRSAVATGKADETDGLALFTVTGNIYVHGITQRAEVAADSASALGIQVDATDSTLDSTLVTDTALTTETTIGDYAVSGTAGGAFTIVQVEDTTTSVMWDTPVLVPAGSIEQASSGTPGALVSGYIIYWSEATGGATCVAA